MEGRDRRRHGGAGAATERHVQGGCNLVLVHDLGEAMVEAKISLLVKLWGEIECGLQSRISDLPEKTDDSDISEARIRRFVTGQRNYNWYGLYYRLDDGAMICVDVEDYIFFGVHSEGKAGVEKYRKIAQRLGEWESGSGWPMFRYPPTKLNLKHSPRKQLGLLGNEESRRACVEEVVSGVCDLWNGLKA